MADTASFDITSTIDFQEVDNALNQARKEVGQRYDFKGAKADIDLSVADKKLTLTTSDEMKMNALWEIVQTRLVRRGVAVKNFKVGDSESAAGAAVRRVIEIQSGIPQGQETEEGAGQHSSRAGARIIAIKGRAAGGHEGAARPRLRRRAPVRQLPLEFLVPAKF